ncbi:acyl-CoA dehydrogenase family protein [Cupriavidus basilensis]
MDTFRTLADSGVIATAFPRDLGGSEASMLLRVRIIEEIARVCSTAASIVTGTDLSSRPIVAGAPRTPRTNRSGAGPWREAVRLLALTEPGAGSDLARLGTTATRHPGGYRLTGTKKFITRATVADMFVAVASLADGPGGSKDSRPSWYRAMRRGCRSRRSSRSSAGTVYPLPRFGWGTSQVPASHRLGEEGQGMALAQDTLVRAYRTRGHCAGAHDRRAPARSAIRGAPPGVRQGGG